MCRVVCQCWNADRRDKKGMGHARSDVPSSAMVG